MNKQSVSESLRSAGEILERLAGQVHSPLSEDELDLFRQDLESAAQLLHQMLPGPGQKWASPGAEFRTTAIRLAGHSARLKAFLQAGADYCNSRMKLLTVPRCGYTSNGDAAEMDLPTKVAVEA